MEEYEIQGGSGRLGVYFKQSNIYEYELNDHLGNVRAVVALNINNMEVRMYTDYYPYGMPILNRKYQSPEGYRYQYQGRNAEKESETDWNSFELRMYDSKIAKWLSPDPAGQYYSPYMAMGNDPVSKVDPDGGFDYQWEAWLFKKLRGGESTVIDNGRDWLVNFNNPNTENTVQTYNHFNFSKHFYFNVNTKVTVGAQAGLKLGSVVEVEGGYNVLNLASWKGVGYDGRKGEWSIGKGDHLKWGAGEPVAVEDFVGAQVSLDKLPFVGKSKIFEDVRLAGKYKKSYYMYHGYNGPREVEGDPDHKADEDIELTVGPKSYWPKKDPTATGYDLIKGVSMKTVANITNSDKEDFRGIQTKFGGKAVIGGEVDVKVGFIW